MLRFPSLAALPAAAASRTRTRQRVLAAAAAEEAGEPSGRVSTATRRVTPLEYKRQSGRTAELVMQTEAELMHVALGLSSSERAESGPQVLGRLRPELQWLPRDTEAGACRFHPDMPSFDLLALDFDTLMSEVELTPEQAQEIDRLSRRYFCDRILNRAQILERCRRIYQLEPFDPRDLQLETKGLLYAFQQLEENNYTITRWVSARATERDEALGALIARNPTLVLPDAGDLAIADVTLFIEFQRELLLQSIKERRVLAERSGLAAQAARRDYLARQGVLAETALREGLGMEDLLLLGLEPEALQGGLSRIGSNAMPFSMEEYERRLWRTGDDGEEVQPRA